MADNLKNAGMGMVQDDGNAVNPARLKKVDAPVEALIGAANGAITMGAFALGVSAATTAIGNRESAHMGALIMKNIKGTHYLPIVAATAAFAALGGLVRNSRARKHNEWAERQLEIQGQSFAERVQNPAPAAALAR